MIDAFSDYWTDHPPAHFLLAAFVGYKAKERQKEVGTMEDLMAMFPTGDLK